MSTLFVLLLIGVGLTLAQDAVIYILGIFNMGHSRTLCVTITVKTDSDLKLSHQVFYVPLELMLCLISVISNKESWSKACWCYHVIELNWSDAPKREKKAVLLDIFWMFTSIMIIQHKRNDWWARNYIV
jgi:hypothetical protein